jgi:hypothetical protein
MNPSLAGFAWAMVGAIFGAGSTYATLKMQIAKTRSDLNGLGAKMRQIEGRAERRWKHSIATAIETAPSLEIAQKHATLLREDAWRD